MLQESELSEYIIISADAVGGADSDAGQEMIRLLLEREGTKAPMKTMPKQEFIPADETPKSLMGDSLEGMFSTMFPAAKK